MKLSDNDKVLLLQSLPLNSCELSYEIMTHKKVYNSDVLLAIPEGKKGLVFFTRFRSENVCFFLVLDDKNNVNDVTVIYTCFNDSLSLGTIFYGTLFSHNSSNYYCIEDIYRYKNNDYKYVPFDKKLETLKTIFKDEIIQSRLNNQYVIFGLPLLSTDFNSLLDCIQELPYKIVQIKHRFFEKKNVRKIVTMNYFRPSNTNNRSLTNKSNTGGQVVFKVSADIEPDIYHLFACQDKKEVYYSDAIIQDYNTSVMMNKLFRNIKENDNLDTVEESDDDEEFENTSENKYVYLDRSYKMNCVYNSKFKKWCPVSLAKEDDVIISLFALNNLNFTKKY